MAKTLKVLLDIVVSVIFFLIIAIFIDLIASKIFGTTTDTNGVTHVNLSGGVLLAITTVLTLVFGVWFYSLLTDYRVKKVDR
jgi:hypothetical protein